MSYSSPTLLKEELDFKLVNGEGLTDIAQFISDLEDWLANSFPGCLRSAAVETSDLDGLTSTLRPWVDELRNLCESRDLQLIRPGEAAQLIRALYGALDWIEDQYRARKISPAAVLSLLSPLEDILVFLSTKRSAV